MKTRLEEQYLTAVRPALMEHFGYKNNLEVPRIEKVVVNMGVGSAVRDSCLLYTSPSPRDLSTSRMPSSA